MKRSSLWTLTAVSALAGSLAACGPEDLASPEPEEIANPIVATTVPKGAATGLRINGAHIMPVQRPGAPRSTAPAATKLLYYGGHVLANVKVVPVYWGTGTSAVPADMHGFYAAVTNSSHMDWLSEYDTNVTAVDGSAGTGQHIGRGTVDAKDYTITPSVTSKNITDDDIQAELKKQIDSGKLPAPDANTMYMFHFPLGIHIDLGGAGSCSTFCAYHSTLSKSGQSVYYGVLPYLGSGSGCEFGCGTGSVFANHTSVASHELIETVTDGEIGLVTGAIGKPLAWYDSVSGEIGDICNAEQGTLAGTTYTVQKEWSNQLNSCIVDKGVVSGPTVNLTAPAAGATVSGSVTVTATASEAGDTISKVDFYADGTLIGSKTASPYSVSWDSTKVGNGSHVLTAKATDSHGKVGTSAGVTVSVKNGGSDTTAPTVKVTSPSAGATVSGSVALTATATDPDDAVAKVEFYAGTTLIATATASPYTASWDSTKVANGTYSITAKGTDSNGNVGTSAAVAVMVNNGGGGQSEVEPNNSFAAANVITDPAGQVTGYITPSGDTDYFKITLPAGKTLVVDLTVPAGVDYDLYVYNSSKAKLAESTNDVGIAEHISVTNTGTTSLIRYINVRDFSGSSSTNAYKLSAQIK